MSSPVFFAARMPAKRAAARTFPLAMVWDSMSLRVAFWRRISPRATASRNITGLEETSTIVASPRLSIWESLFMKSQESGRSGLDGFWSFDAAFPFLDDRAHLFGRVQFGFDVFEAVPRQHAEQIGCDKDLAI